jgi:hydrogenase-4 membrane subunit HyfE
MEDKVKYFVIFRTVLTTLVLLHAITTQQAYAYIDPGTGSYILQMTIAALLAGLFTMKLFMNKIKTLFKNFFSRKNKSEEIKE